MVSVPYWFTDDDVSMRIARSTRLPEHGVTGLAVGNTVGPEVVGDTVGCEVVGELVGDSVRSRRRSYSVSSTVSSVNPPEWPVTDPRLAVPTKFTISVSRIEHSYRGPGS